MIMQSNGYFYLDIELIVMADGMRLLLAGSRALLTAILCLAGLLAAALAALQIYWHRPNKQADHAGPMCGRCGYPTEGVAGPACPECGTAYSQVPVRRPGRRAATRLPVASWCLLAPLPLMMIYILISEYTFVRVPALGHSFAGYVHPWWLAGPTVIVLGAVWIGGAVACGRRGTTQGR